MNSSLPAFKNTSRDKSQHTPNYTEEMRRIQGLSGSNFGLVTGCHDSGKYRDFHPSPKVSDGTANTKVVTTSSETVHTHQSK
jgi:hypothetical protein